MSAARPDRWAAERQELLQRWARGIVASTLSSARRGGVPSLRAEVSALKWLHASAPDAILAPGWRS